MEIFNILINFSYHVLWNFGVLFIVLITGIIYLFLLPSGDNHSRKKTTLFLIGLFVFFVALGSPLNILGRLIFRAHMIQMLLLVFIAAPLLLYGLKTKVFDWLMERFQLHFFAQKFTKPLLAVLIFHSLWMLYHLPSVFNFVRIQYVWNYLSVFAIFVASLILWIPIFPVVKSVKRLTGKSMKKYCIMNVILFFPMAFIYLLVPNSLYPIYSDPDLLLTALTLCLPPGVSMDSLPDNLIETLLPFSPIHEQKYAAIILIFHLIILTIASLFPLKRKKIKDIQLTK